MLASTWAYDPRSTVTAVGFDIALQLVITTPPSNYRGADDRVSPLGPTCHDAAVVVPRRSRQEGLHQIGNSLECGVMNQPNWHLLEALSNPVGCALVMDRPLLTIDSPVALAAQGATTLRGSLRAAAYACQAIDPSGLA
jgi:hypothetical protein